MDNAIGSNGPNPKAATSSALRALEVLAARQALRLPRIVLLMLSSLVPFPASATVTFLGDWADFGSQFQETGPQTRLLDGLPVEWVAGYGANHWRIVQERGKDRLQVERDLT